MRKNGRVWYEYERYVREHMEEHKTHRLKHIGVLIKLNWFYRIRKKGVPYLYPDVPVNPNAKAKISNKDNKKSDNGDIRIPIMSYVSRLMSYDVISFDMFDTLVFRPFANPRDLFFLLGNEFNVLDFRKIRVDAEMQAREIKKARFGTTEVTLEEIYKLIESRTGINAEYGTKKEIEIESDMIFPNEYMLKVFSILKEQGKKIVITSDMYISENHLMHILKKCGYRGIRAEDIFVSCDYGCSKRDGGLYEVVKNNNKKMDRMAHVGDNYTTDVVVAKKHNIDAYYYRNVNDIGKFRNSMGMSDLIGSAYAGIINAFLYSGNNDMSPFFKYGFCEGGIYILGFCNWIHNQCDMYDVDKIVFLTRDGEIYQKVYNKLFPNDNTELFYWSRIANIKSTVRFMKSNFLSSCIKNKAADKMNYSARDILASLDLCNCIVHLKEYGLREDTVITWSNYKVLENMLMDCWDDVIKAYKPYEDGAKCALKRIISDSKKIAVIDVGWTGTGPLGIKRLVEDIWGWNVEVECFVAASRVWGHTSNINEITKNVIKPYIFSRQLNRNLYDLHVRTNNNTNNIYFELFTQATYPSFGGYKMFNNKIMCQFDFPEVENYKIIKEIHDGILKFCNTYVEHFGNYSWLLNISGYDAYIPYRQAIISMSFLKNYFGDFKFARGISSDNAEQEMECLKDIWEKERM
ncbi:MAG: hypothetical protein E7279_08735 [Lachnospiraceae bacterium]|nr:hypothetical protein [Lachnospiraceae bacterium]